MKKVSKRSTKYPRIILDPVHGFIELTPVQEELLNQPELQRMRGVKQLGLVDLVFPGGHHSRIEHCLGASFVATKIADQVRLPDKEKTLVQATALLHDIGHTPFSHALEPLLPKDSMEITREVIQGGKKTLPGGGNIPSILKKYGLSPKEVADLICNRYGGKKYLQQIIFSEIDCDQLDYLARDSYYTGATHGEINTDRVISMMRLAGSEITFIEKGLTEIEELIVGREHMYSSVYLHHTATVAEKMLLRAVEKIKEKSPDFMYMTDAQLMAALLAGNSYSKEMMERILFRRLFKRAFEINSRTASKREVELVDKLCKKGEKKVETELAAKSGIPQGYVLVDLPANVISLSEPRIKEFNITILRKDGSTAKVGELSTLVQALSKRIATPTLLTVYAPEEYRERAASAAKDYINLFH
ncbi:HD domain-containing protein [archaeon]|nr:HD domain-containing protein [archaeon]